VLQEISLKLVLKLRRFKVTV